MSTITTEAVELTRKPEDVPGITRPMTYEEYMASPEEMARYDIIDGWKVYHKWGVDQLTNPTRQHQRIQGNIYRPFYAFEQQAQEGEVILPPCDILVRLNPTRTRQPDLIFISRERLVENLPSTDPAPLNPAPELVVEILSPSDTRRVRLAKIEDYMTVGVQECWLVNLSAETVEVLRLSADGIETVAVYGRGQTVTSFTFPGLTVAVDTIFTD